MFRLVFMVPIVAALALAAGVVACGGDDDDDGGSSPAPTTAAQPTASGQGGGGGATRVTAADFSFSPTTLTARAGQPVNLEVVNNGQAPHTFTIANVVDSGTINAGQSRTVSFTPSAAGTLQFVCSIHASMTGTVTVQ